MNEAKKQKALEITAKIIITTFKIVMIPAKILILCMLAPYMLLYIAMTGKKKRR